MVNQVLEIARLEGRATDLDRVAEPLDHAVDDVVEGLRDEAAARRIRVIVADEGRLPAVLADPRGLRTVLTNLLQNAVTYSPEGGEVRLSATQGLGGVRVVIEDDGPGVDPDDLERLMRPFEQGENALTRQAEGAGLGLPIVALLARAMGGTLRLISEPGRGLTAEVDLPAADEPADITDEALRPPRERAACRRLLLDIVGRDTGAVRAAVRGRLSAKEESVTDRANTEARSKMRSILLMILGVPLPIILLLAFCTHHF